MNPYQTGGGQGGRPQLRIGGPVPPVLKSFLIACGMGFLLQLLWPQLTVYLGLTPAAFWRGAVFQLVTFHFLHGNMWHIILNLFVLWMFAGELEILWGRKKFIVYLVVVGLGAGLCQVLFTPDLKVPVIGASGIVYGILMAYGMTYPNRMVYLYFLFPVKVKWFVIALGVIELASSISGRAEMSGVAHLAHLGGMVFGFIFLRYDRIFLRLRDKYYRRKLDKIKKENRHLYVVRGDDDDKPYYH